MFAEIIIYQWLILKIEADILVPLGLLLKKACSVFTD